VISGFGLEDMEWQLTGQIFAWNSRQDLVECSTFSFLINTGAEVGFAIEGAGNGLFATKSCPVRLPYFNDHGEEIDEDSLPPFCSQYLRVR
jgi:hypothetical protein